MEGIGIDKSVHVRISREIPAHVIRDLCLGFGVWGFRIVWVFP